MENTIVKKINLWIVLMAIIICVASLVIVISAKDNNYMENRNNLMNEATAIAENKNVLENSTIIGEVEGIPLYAEELELFAIKMKAQNMASPYKEALKHIVKFKHDIKLAEKYNITVSDEEVSGFTEEQREVFEGSEDQDLKQFVKDYINALGMDNEEYWTKYKPIENERLILHSKVETYMKDNNIYMINEDEIAYSITDKKYSDMIEE